VNEVLGGLHEGCALEVKLRPRRSLIESRRKAQEEMHLELSQDLLVVIDLSEVILNVNLLSPPRSAKGAAEKWVSVGL